jgi:hypothetical protein
LQESEPSGNDLNREAIMKISFVGKMLIAFVAVGSMVGSQSAFASGRISLSEHNNNQTAKVRLGSQVTLTLHSMYWSLTPVKVKASLTEKGSVIKKPIFPSPTAPAGCHIVGSGCGSQSWTFIATKLGITHLRATRTSCGEAMLCTGSNGAYLVTLKVTA